MGSLTAYPEFETTPRVAAKQDSDSLAKYLSSMSDLPKLGWLAL